MLAGRPICRAIARGFTPFSPPARSKPSLSKTRHQDVSDSFLALVWVALLFVSMFCIPLTSFHLYVSRKALRLNTLTNPPCCRGQGYHWFTGAIARPTRVITSVIHNDQLTEAASCKLALAKQQKARGCAVKYQKRVAVVDRCTVLHDSLPKIYSC